MSYRKVKNEPNIECQIINYDYKDKMFKYLTSNKFCVDFQKNYPHEFSPLINIMVLKDDFFRPLTLPHLLCKPEISKVELLENFKNMSINFFFKVEPEKFDEFINAFGINFNEGKFLSEEEWYKIVLCWFWSRYYKEILFFGHYHNNIIKYKGKKRFAFLVSKLKLDKNDEVTSLFERKFEGLYTTKRMTFSDIKFGKTRCPLFNEKCLESIDNGAIISPFIKHHLFSAFAEYIVFSDYYYFILPCESKENDAYWSIAVKKESIKNKEASFLEFIRDFMHLMNPKIDSDNIGKTKKHISSNFLNSIPADAMERIISNYSQYQELQEPKEIESLIVLRKYENNSKNEGEIVNPIDFYFSKSEKDRVNFRNLTIELLEKIKVELPIHYKFDDKNYKTILKMENSNEKGKKFEEFIKNMLNGIGFVTSPQNDDFCEEFKTYFFNIHNKRLDLMIFGPNPAVNIVCEIKSSRKKEEVNKGERYLASIFINEITYIRDLFSNIYKDKAEKMLGLKTILFCNWNPLKKKYKSPEYLHVFTMQDLYNPKTIYDKIFKLLF